MKKRGHVDAPTNTADSASKRTRKERVTHVADTNRLHVEFLREEFARMKPAVKRRALDNAAAYEAGSLPSWRSNNGSTLDEGRRGINAVLSGDDGAISFESYFGHSTYSADAALLGDREQSAMLVHGNIEGRTFKHARDNLDTLLSGVPLTLGETGEVQLLPAQRLWIALFHTRYPFPAYVSFKRFKLNCGNDHEVRIERPAGHSPSFMLCSLPTGSGKTMLSLCAAMLPVSTFGRFQAYRAAASTDTATTETTPLAYTNLVKVTKKTCVETTLTRVVLIQCPSELVDQWAEAARRVSLGFARDPRVGKGFIVWTGTGVLTAQKTGRGERKGEVLQERVTKTLQSAHDLSVEANSAVCWVADNSTTSSKAMLYRDPNLRVSTRIIDEAKKNGTTEPRTHGVPRVSPCDVALLINATLPSLVDTTSTQRYHPLTRAMGGSGFDLSNTSHCAIMQASNTPSWLNAMVGLGMRSLLPAGILKKTLRMRLTSLGGRVFGTDSQLSSVDDILNTVLNRELTASRTWGIDIEWKVAALDGMKVILLNAEGGDPVTRFTAAIEANAEQHAAVHATLPPPSAPAPSDDQSARLLAETKLQLEFLMCLKRVLSALRDALDFGTTPPEDPIDLEPIPRAPARTPARPPACYRAACSRACSDRAACLPQPKSVAFLPAAGT